MKTIVMIPARLAASRLPDKPLADIGGKPMIQHVWERAREAHGIDGVFIATPDQRIIDVVMGFGGEAILTRADHETGTDDLSTTTQLSVWLSREGLMPRRSRASADDLALALRLRGALRRALELNHDGTSEPLPELAQALGELFPGLQITETDITGSGHAE